MRCYTEQELRQYAEKQAETIVVRTHDENGNSRDTRRKAMQYESHIISRIILGALLAILSGADKQTAADTAEYIGILLMRYRHDGEMNSYDTIYLPIKSFPGAAEEAEKKYEAIYDYYEEGYGKTTLSEKFNTWEEAQAWIECAKQNMSAQSRI
jgi:DNA-binding GntR family transcriptional regulator